MAYDARVPHQTLEASIKALRVPALLVANTPTADVLAINELALAEVSDDILVGSNLLAVFREHELASQALLDVCAGHNQAVERLAFNGNPEAWEVVSHLPEISGYPPCVFMSFHRTTETRDRAVATHRRDQLAVECAILIDRTRSDLATQAEMARMNYLQVEQMAKVWTSRLREIEELHNASLSVAGDHLLS